MSFTRKALSVTGVAALAISTAFAQGVPQGIANCVTEQPDAARLACFDREVARLTQPSETVASTPVAPTQTAPAAPPVASSPPQNVTSNSDEFGLSRELARKRQKQVGEPRAEKTELNATVNKVTTKVYGELVLELDNGQVWAQPEKKLGTIIKAGEKVRITQGAIGSYFLTSESGATTRVKRVR